MGAVDFGPKDLHAGKTPPNQRQASDKDPAGNPIAPTKNLTKQAACGNRPAAFLFGGEVMGVGFGRFVDLEWT